MTSMQTLVLDTSAIVAVSFGEPDSQVIDQYFAAADQLFMSTVNLAECLMTFRRNQPSRAAELSRQLLISEIEFVPPDRTQAEIAAEARFRFPLNFGDCFAYALAKTRNVPLLTLDRDFRSADIGVVFP